MRLEDQICGCGKTKVRIKIQVSICPDDDIIFYTQHREKPIHIDDVREDDKSN